ncbi:MAG: hypothetical protein K5790_04720 [Nitrosopumilus sp.]|uniref:hypothetical protein n=1 Tax=Nitrosopumilus sp. TaxID=2024843 RepID=UPI00247C7DA3|nr:hypothetical protein [Nitrosopumilus sp.]MCV0392583.1 hypothetical protein [Nitrosopumilus sp.]
MEKESKKSHSNSNLKDSLDKEDISREIFYACGICEGPLVPVSSCTFCKRTSLRRCNRCNRIKDMKVHESCKILVNFGWAIAKKHLQE